MIGPIASGLCHEELPIVEVAVDEQCRGSRAENDGRGSDTARRGSDPGHEHRLDCLQKSGDGVRAQRFQDVAADPQLDQPGDDVLVPLPGDHDRGEVPEPGRLADGLEHFDAVDERHLDIQHQQIQVAGVDQPQRFNAVAALRHPARKRLHQLTAKNEARRRIVVADQHMHVMLPACRTAAAFNSVAHASRSLISCAAAT
jgi:hypothetical protein